MALKWTEQLDDNDNTFYEAPSPFIDVTDLLHDDGTPICWRLRQRMVGDKIEWYEDHDSELSDVVPDSWPTIEEAKAAIEKADQTIRETIEREEEVIEG